MEIKMSAFQNFDSLICLLYVVIWFSTFVPATSDGEHKQLVPHIKFNQSLSSVNVILPFNISMKIEKPIGLERCWKLVGDSRETCLLKQFKKKFLSSQMGHQLSISVGQPLDPISLVPNCSGVSSNILCDILCAKKRNPPLLKSLNKNCNKLYQSLEHLIRIRRSNSKPLLKVHSLVSQPPLTGIPMIKPEFSKGYPTVDGGQKNEDSFFNKTSQRYRDDDRFPNQIDNGVIVFRSLPKGHPYITYGRTYSNNYLWASPVAEMFLPDDMPLNILEAFKNKKSSEVILNKTMEAQPGVAVFVIVCFLMGVLMPLAGLVVCVCSCHDRCRTGKSQSGGTHCFDCKRKVLTASLSIFCLILIAGIGLNFENNEALRSSVESMQDTLQDIVQDVTTFMRNTKTRFRFLVKSSFDLTASTIEADLDDVEYFLGRPIQKELLEEAKINEAFDSLIRINSVLTDVSSRLKGLERSRTEASSRAKEVHNQVASLRREIDGLISRCSENDQFLCNSINTTGLYASYPFDTITFLDQLSHLDAINFGRLTERVTLARFEFANIPTSIGKNTKEQREETKRTLNSISLRLHDRINQLDLLSPGIELHTTQIMRKVSDIVQMSQNYETFRWYFGTGASSLLVCVCLSLIVGILLICCFCRTDNRPSSECSSSYTGKIFLFATIFMFLVSGIIWCATVVLFLSGTQSYLFICRPLRENDHFLSLSTLLDTDGLLFPYDGFLKGFLDIWGGESLRINHVLKECKTGESVYKTFKLHRLFSIEKETSEFHFKDLKTSLDFKLNITQFQFVTSEVEENLQKFIKSVNFDLTPYRRKLEKPLIGTNILSFAEDMESVAGRVSTAETSAELYRLVSKTRNLIAKVIHPLVKRKEDLAYQVSSLDMKLLPVPRQISENINHIRGIQHYIDQKAELLAKSHAKVYVNRLKGYLKQYAYHLKNATIQGEFSCKPIWSCFEVLRNYICNDIVEKLNQMWLTTCFCLLIFLPAIAISFHLSQFYLQGTTSSRDQEEREVLPSHSVSSSWLIPSPRDRSRHQTFPSGREETSFGGHTTVQATTSGSSMYPQDVGPHHGGIFPSDPVPSHWQDHKEISWTSAPDLSCQPTMSRPTHQTIQSDSFYHNLPFRNETSTNPRPMPQTFHQEHSPRDNPIISQEQVFHFPEPPPRPTHKKPQMYQKPPYPEPSTSSSHHASHHRRRTKRKDIEEPEWRGTSSDVFAAAQITAWRDAVKAGADFITPEMVAAHVGKPADWVKAVWNADLRTLPRPETQFTHTSHGRKGLCGFGSHEH